MLLQLTPDPTMTNELLSTLTGATMVVSIIEWVKNTKVVPFINRNSTALNRVVSWVGAFLAGTGIHYTFNQDAGVLTISGLSAGVIFHTALITTKQYALQWMLYRGVVKPQQGAEPPVVPAAKQ